jgi:hypothetical protein
MRPITRPPYLCAILNFTRPQGSGTAFELSFATTYMVCASGATTASYDDSP